MSAYGAERHPDPMLSLHDPVHSSRTRVTTHRTDRALHEARRLQEAAKRERDGYRRAIYHYQQLMRHRIANPLHVIQGMAASLLELESVASPTAREMLHAIVSESRRLEEISCSPRAQDPIEAVLTSEP
jgi:signal transduction histidine kinase